MPYGHLAGDWAAPDLAGARLTARGAQLARLRPVAFFALARFAVARFRVDFFAVDFLAVDFFAVDFFAVDFFAVAFLGDAFLAVVRFFAAFLAAGAVFLTGAISRPFL